MSSDHQHKDNDKDEEKDRPSVTGLEYKYKITWQEIMAIWRVGEASQQQWREHWQERGFGSWQQWRTAYAKPLNPQNMQWYVYEIKDLAVLSEMCGAPTRGWIDKCYQGKKTRKLGDHLVQEFVRENKKVNAIKKNPPYQTILTGILHEKDVILIEGMHRALAIHSLAADDKYDGNATIAVGVYSADSVPVLGTGDAGTRV